MECIAATSGVRTSLDLILGLPRQTAASFGETLETAINTGAGHISLRHDLPCAGCLLLTCEKEQMACIRGITPDHVLDAVSRVMLGSPA